MQPFMLRERYKCRLKCEHGVKCQLVRGHKADQPGMVPIHQWHCKQCYDEGVIGAVLPVAGSDERKRDGKA